MKSKAKRISLNEVTRHFDENADLDFQGTAYVDFKTLVKLYGDPDEGYRWHGRVSWGLKFPYGTVALIEDQRNDKKKLSSVDTLNEFNVFGREQKAFMLVYKDIKDIKKKRINTVVTTLLFIAVFTAWGWASIYSGGIP